ncbi:MAG TPA: DUF4019 domain-containing protein [Desulfomonilaceae bacterium]|nr:DUF4019 domain-containing protein [Desulfomonilaceae bacterium]
MCLSMADYQLPMDNEKEKEIAMARGIVCLVAFSLVFLVSAAMAADSEKETAAVAAAEKWLAVVDQGRYAESWQEAAEYFRTAVGKEQWEQALLAVRKPLGNLISRKVKSTTYTTSLPGAPDGQYVVIQFETSFANKKDAVETVSPMMDKDGKWRVSGYYIK